MTYPHGSTAAYYTYLSETYDIPVTAIWMALAHTSGVWTWRG